MMKTVLTSGLALALLAGGAWAQAAPPPAPAGTTQPPAGITLPPAPADVVPPPAAAPPRPMATRAPPPGGPATFDDAGPGAPPLEEAGRHRLPPPPPPPPKAAHIHLQHGDSILDVKCAEDEPMKTCADLTLQLLDRLQGPKT